LRSWQFCHFRIAPSKDGFFVEKRASWRLAEINHLEILVDSLESVLPAFD